MKMVHILYTVLLITVTACGGSSDSDGQELLATASQITDKFGQTTDSFVVGDDVVITATITNPSSVVRTIEFTSPLITIQILSEDATTLIFDPDFGLSFPAVVMEIVIDPFGEIVRTLTWNGINNVGAQVEPGTYQVVARFKGVDGAHSVVHQDLIQLL